MLWLRVQQFGLFSTEPAPPRPITKLCPLAAPPPPQQQQTQQRQRRRQQQAAAGASCDDEQKAQAAAWGENQSAKQQTQRLEPLLGSRECWFRGVGVGDEEVTSEGFGGEWVDFWHVCCESAMWGFEPYFGNTSGNKRSERSCFAHARQAVVVCVFGSHMSHPCRRRRAAAAGAATPQEKEEKEEKDMNFFVWPPATRAHTP
jgi:hypothetical protein